MNPMMLELLGYVASALVAISLMMSSILRLRIINLLGALTFAVYGWLIGATPVALVNLFIVGINLYYLKGMLRGREFFRLLEVAPDSAYLEYFLDFYAREIRRFLPHFHHHEHPAELNLLVLRDLMPAGVFMADVQGDTARVRLDFVIPQYRDFKIGGFLFSESAGFFRERGIKRIVTERGTDVHAAYLRRMGFGPAPAAGGELYEYRLAG